MKKMTTFLFAGLLSESCHCMQQQPPNRPKTPPQPTAIPVAAPAAPARPLNVARINNEQRDRLRQAHYRLNAALYAIDNNNR